MLPAASRTGIENWRITMAAFAGFGLVMTCVMLFATLRRNRFRPWLPTYAAVTAMLPAQLLLHRCRVLIDALRYGVFVRVGTRLIRPVVGVAGECRREHVRHDRECGVAQRRADAVAFDRLNLILGLARTDEDAEPGAEHGLAWRIRERQPRVEVVLRRLVGRRGVRIDDAGVDVELHLQVILFGERRVVLVADAVIERGLRPEVPLILRVGDRVILLDVTFTGCTVVERARRAHVPEVLHGGCLVGEERGQVGERVGGAAQPVRRHADGAELAADLHEV